MAPAAKAAKAAKAPAAAAQSAPSEPFMYPVPLYVRNTFLEAQTVRPPSLEGFYLERQVFSCPGSRVSEPGSGCEGASARAGTPAPYCPGEQFLKDAAYGSSAPLAVCSWPLAHAGAAKVEKAKAGGAAPAAAAPELDANSECSTTDTNLRSPPSPELDQATAGEAKAAGPPLPSAGSAGHHLQQCKPCAFFHTKGCSSGTDCQFCHMCEAGEKTRRQKEKRALFGAMRQMQRLASSGWSNGSKLE